MASVTTRNGPPKPKPFSFSYSKLKNFETCPKRHWHIDVAKDVKEEESESLLWGNTVHKALAERISKGTALPVGMQDYESWCERILRGGGDIKVEQQLAITAQFGPTAWFGKDAWYRGIGDVIKVVGDVALIVDWKTGKILEDSHQLALMAACVFAHYPEVNHVRSIFVWLKEDAETKEDFARSAMPEMWKQIWPRVEALKNAHETMNYPAKTSGLCKRYCPVTQCPHHGEGR